MTLRLPSLVARLNGDARDLAALRIALCLVVLLSPDVHSAVAVAHIAPQLQQAPIGLAWVPHPQLPLWLLQALYAALVGGAVLGLIGKWTQQALTVAALAAVVLLGLPQYSGTVRHYHHLLWFLALLAASPCGDAWSVDARRKLVPPPSGRYGVPLALAWLLFGQIYFWPGVHKWATQGLHWATGDQLIQLMRWKWLQLGEQPAVRWDHWPWLIHAGGVAVLLFEVLALPLQFWPKARPWLVLAAVGFHLASAEIVRIAFPSLWMLWMGLLPWSRWLRPGQLPQAQAPQFAPLVVGALLCVGVAVPGALGVYGSWPFACYPPFDRPMQDKMPAMRTEIQDFMGQWRVVSLRPAGMDSQRWWGMQWQLVLDKDKARQDNALHRYATSVLAAQRSAGVATHAVRLWRVWYETDPDRRGQLAQKTLLWTENGPPLAGAAVAP